jgi:hypothetical protein
MNYRWDENQDMQKFVYNGIKRWFGNKNKVSVDNQALSNIIYSFGQLKMKWIDIPQEIKECFYNGIEKNSSRFISREIGDIIYG